MPKSIIQDNEIANVLKIKKAVAMIIAANGVLTIGKNLEQAYLRMELVEHYAKIKYLSNVLGGTIPLPDDDIKMFLKKIN